MTRTLTTRRVTVLVAVALVCGAALAPRFAAAGAVHTSQATGGLTYTDSTGTTVTLTHRPLRFACATSICEDIAYQLGLKPVAVSDTFSAAPQIYGAAAKSFGHIGGTFFQPSLEDIAAARPDIVIGLAGVHDKLRSALKPIAPLYIMDLSTYNDSIHYLLDMGRLTGRMAQAQTAVAAFRHKLAAYEARSPKMLSAAFMSGSPTNFALDTDHALYGGLLSLVTKWPWPAPPRLQSGREQDNTIPYSLEKVLAVNPDVIFVDSGGATTPLSKALASNPLWGQLKAVSLQSPVGPTQGRQERPHLRGGTQHLGVRARVALAGPHARPGDASALPVDVPPSPAIAADEEAALTTPPTPWDPTPSPDRGRGEQRR